MKNTYNHYILGSGFVAKVSLPLLTIIASLQPVLYAFIGWHWYSLEKALWGLLFGILAAIFWYLGLIQEDNQLKSISNNEKSFGQRLKSLYFLTTSVVQLSLIVVLTTMTLYDIIMKNIAVY